MTEKIGDNITGLLNYLTAKHIRGKTKHPIFLALKFPKAVKLYYNKSIIDDRHRSTVGILVEMHKKLRSL